LAGHAIRTRNATAITPSRQLVTNKAAMMRRLRTERMLVEDYLKMGQDGAPSLSR
jgi:hypothetical protein